MRHTARVNHASSLAQSHRNSVLPHRVVGQARLCALCLGMELLLYAYGRVCGCPKQYQTFPCEHAKAQTCHTRLHRLWVTAPRAWWHSRHNFVKTLHFSNLNAHLNWLRKVLAHKPHHRKGTLEDKSQTLRFKSQRCRYKRKSAPNACIQSSTITAFCAAGHISSNSLSHIEGDIGVGVSVCEHVRAHCACALCARACRSAFEGS